MRISHTGAGGGAPRAADDVASDGVASDGEVVGAELTGADAGGAGSVGTGAGEVSAPLAQRRGRFVVWGPPVACAVLGLLGGAGYGLLAPPQYTAQGHVVLAPVAGQDRHATVGFAQVYVRVAAGAAVLTRAAELSGLDADALRGRVQAEASPDAPVIEVFGTASGAAEAADVTNAVLEALVAHGNGAAGATGAELSVLSAAHPPAAPTTPGPVVYAVVGLCAGGLVGCLVLLARGGQRSRGGG